MKILKRIGITLLILIAIPLIAALFINGDFAVEKTVDIKKPKSEVFDYIKLIKNQDEFSVWAKMDPKMKKSYKGEDGKVGFVSMWDSKNENVGKGEQELTKVVDGQRIEMLLRFKEPFEVENKAYMTTESKDSSTTTVKWGFTGSTPYPFNFMCLFMDMEEMVGKDFETGLQNLKSNLEKK